MRERPYHYTFEPPHGEVRTNAVYVPHRVPVYDARPLASGLSLDREGFSLIDAESEVADFYNEDELRRVYYPEAERLVADATGADRVVIFDHTIRRRVPGLEDRTKEGPRQPALRVHNDYTIRSGPQRVSDLMGAEAEALLRRRFAIVNIWRPIRGPLRDAPLAVCDAGSVAFSDLVPSDQIYPDRRGEIYVVTHNPDQRWYYVPAMQRDEALLLKCYELGAGRDRALRAARGVRGSDRARRCPAAREHRAPDFGVLSEVTAMRGGPPRADDTGITR